MTKEVRRMNNQLRDLATKCLHPDESDRNNYQIILHSIYRKGNLTFCVGNWIMSTNFEWSWATHLHSMPDHDERVTSRKGKEGN